MPHLRASSPSSVLFAVLLCATIAVFAQDAPRPACVLETPSGFSFDFIGYHRGPPWTKLFEDLNTEVTLNFCSNNASVCAENASIIALDESGACKGTLAFWGEEDDATVTFIDEDQRNRGIQAVFTNGKADSCPENDTVTTTLNLLCATMHQDPNVPSFEYREIFPDNSERICDFEINFLAPEACFSAPPRAPPQTSSGISGGWVFVIIVVVFFFAYFAGGMLFNCLVTGAKGAESVPNVSFWRSLPGLVSDGCSYTQTVFCGGGGGGVYGASATDNYREVGQPTLYGSQNGSGVTAGANNGVGPQFSQSSASNVNNNGL